MILMSISLLLSLMDLGPAKALGTKAGMCLMGLTVWMILAVPTSFWRGGSLGVITGAWIRVLFVFLITGSLLLTVKQCRGAVTAIALGTALGALMLTVKGQMVGERLALTGRFGNANDVAVMMLFGLPCIGYVIFDKQSNVFRRGGAVVGGLLALAAIAKTGSRTGLIGLLVLVIVLMLRVSLAGKIKMVVGFVALLVLGVIFLPHSTIVRWELLVSRNMAIEDIQNAAEANMLIKGMASSNDRQQLLVNSIKTAFRFPLFGVGAGNYGAYRAKLDEQNGRYSSWNGTHNTYTQWASENGLPAFILFIALLVFSFKSVNRLVKRARKIDSPEARQIEALAFTLRATLTVACAVIFFEHVAYDMGVPLILGMIVSLERVATVRLAALEAAAPQVLTAPRPMRPFRPYPIPPTVSV